VTTAPPVERVDRLDATDVRDVLALAGAAGDADGTYPLSEDTVLRVREGGDRPAIHLLVRTSDGELAGYAYLDTTDEDEGAAGELVVAPTRRRQGVGRALATTALQIARAGDPRGRLRFWAHGDHPAAGAFAESLGFERTRALWQMRRPLSTPLPETRLADGVVLRAFRPGADDAAWLAVNSRAFAHHPEQGRWSVDDLRVRMDEPWFDPSGFLLATSSSTDRLLGFHWTKVHGIGPDRIGEVYVVGVDPDEQGRGLGRSLTVAGLRHLRGQGIDQAMLYVDESNTEAVALYSRLGFTRWSTDVSYQHTLPVTA
jgi:mycothiol synthase